MPAEVAKVNEQLAALAPAMPAARAFAAARAELAELQQLAQDADADLSEMAREDLPCARGVQSLAVVGC